LYRAVQFLRRQKSAAFGELLKALKTDVQSALVGLDEKASKCFQEKGRVYPKFEEVQIFVGRCADKESAEKLRAALDKVDVDWDKSTEALNNLLEKSGKPKLDAEGLKDLTKDPTEEASEKMKKDMEMWRKHKEQEAAKDRAGMDGKDAKDSKDAKDAKDLKKGAEELARKVAGKMEKQEMAFAMSTARLSRSACRSSSL